MKVLTLNNFPDYQLLDSGEGERLERLGQFTLIRPDPQIIWQKGLPKEQWQKADAQFIRTQGDKGRWEIKSQIPDKWLMEYQGVKFFGKLSPFKHTGVFPEQAVHWEFISKVISNKSDRGGAEERSQESTAAQLLQARTHLRNRSDRTPISDEDSNGAASRQDPKEPRVLNLFGYTGIASLVALKAGASVTHVDASYPAIGWFKDNLKASNLEDKPIRYIEDDVVKFVQREVKRGSKYDGIIMDPPIYGHGPKGEVWNFNKSFPQLLKLCSQLLSDKPLFIIVNAYAISTSAITLNNIMEDNFSYLGGTIEYGELTLKEESRSRLLSTGIFARWVKN